MILSHRYLGVSINLELEYCFIGFDGLSICLVGVYSTFACPGFIVWLNKVFDIAITGLKSGMEISL